jgi:hypothetical protein
LCSPEGLAVVVVAVKLRRVAVVLTVEGLVVKVLMGVKALALLVVVVVVVVVAIAIAIAIADAVEVVVVVQVAPMLPLLRRSPTQMPKRIWWRTANASVKSRSGGSWSGTSPMSEMPACALSVSTLERT